MGIVTVKGPGYRGEDCRAGGKEGAGSLARVKKVVSVNLLIRISGFFPRTSLLLEIHDVKYTCSRNKHLA